MARPDLPDDVRFRGNRERTENNDAIDAIVAEWTKTLDLQTIMKMLVAANVPAGPVSAIDDIVSDEQNQARNVVVHLGDDAGNSVATNAPVPRFANHGSVLTHAARKIGADTGAVMTELAKLRGSLGQPVVDKVTWDRTLGR